MSSNVVASAAAAAVPVVQEANAVAANVVANAAESPSTFSKLLNTFALAGIAFLAAYGAATLMTEVDRLYGQKNRRKMPEKNLMSPRKVEVRPEEPWVPKTSEENAQVAPEKQEEEKGTPPLPSIPEEKREEEEKEEETVYYFAKPYPQLTALLANTNSNTSSTPVLPQDSVSSDPAPLQSVGQSSQEQSREAQGNS